MRLCNRLLLMLNVILYVALLHSCSDSGTDTKTDITKDSIPAFRGDLLESEVITTFSTTGVDSLCVDNGMDKIEGVSYNYAVKMVKLTYWTVDVEGEKTKASGTLFIPQKEGESPLLCVNHATQTKNEQVPWMDDPWGGIAMYNVWECHLAVQAASMGYVSFFPDYLGFGESFLPHPYYLARTLGQTVSDGILAAQEYCEKGEIALKDELFMMGYSQGATVSLAAQREIEKNFADKITLKGVLAGGGHFDQLAWMKHILSLEVFSKNNGPQTYVPAFVFKTYNDLSDSNYLPTVFTEKYLSAVDSMFDMSHFSWSIKSVLNDTIRCTFNEAFITDFLAGEEHYFTNLLKENSLCDFAPQAPLLFVNGTADDCSPPALVEDVVSRLKENGAVDVTLRVVDGTHGKEAYEHYMREAFQWFQSL